MRPARVFLNRMLELLRQNYDTSSIKLTQPFRRDRRCFARFLEKYNGVSMYTHRKVDHVVELDACLDGIGAVWKNYVYHLPIPKHYLNLTIVHLEMINILVAIKAFGPFWAQKKVLVKCDNQAVVSVLKHSRTKDAFLAACARNIWLLAAWYDLEMDYVHIQGKENVVADLLSRWKNTPNNVLKLHSHIADPLWLNVPCCTLFCRASTGEIGSGSQKTPGFRFETQNRELLCVIVQVLCGLLCLCEIKCIPVECNACVVLLRVFNYTKSNCQHVG